MSVLLVGQDVVHYEVMGRGQPLIFLHSWVGSWRYWLATMQALSIGYRSYAIDLWGFGDTSKIAHRYSLDQQACLIQEFIQKMGINKCSLVGHGLGAVIAVLFAVKDPDLIEKILAVECPIDGTCIDSKLRTNSPLQLFDWLVPDQADIETIQMDAVKTDPKANEISFISYELLDWTEIWNKVKTPLVLLHGQKDPVVFGPKPDRTYDLLNKAQMMYFEHSGHFPMIEESSKFNRLLFDYLALPPGGSPHQLQTKEEWKRRIR
jgi:pimeloyl-ACP methyl ester carboxylesterase